MQDYEPTRTAPSAVRTHINDLIEVESRIGGGPEDGTGVLVEFADMSVSTLRAKCLTGRGII
jgi:hypothetical protein